LVKFVINKYMDDFSQNQENSECSYTNKLKTSILKRSSESSKTEKDTTDDFYNTTYSINIYIDVIDGIVNNENVNSIYCKYHNYYLGNELNKILAKDSKQYYDKFNDNVYISLTKDDAPPAITKPHVKQSNGGTKKKYRKN